MVPTHLLRRGLAAVLVAVCVAAASCGTPTGQWADTRLQTVVGGTGAVLDVSCGSETFCMAVGSREPDSPAGWFAAVFDGSSWRPLTGPPVSAISCGSSSTCAGITPDGFAAWDGTRWHEVASATLFGPTPSGRSGTAVSCFGRDCTVLDSGHMGRWDGRRWTVVAGGDSNASVISCTSVCLASGYPGVVSRWDGTAWTVVGRISRPSSSGGVVVSAISCEDRDRCVIAGTWPHLPTSGYPAPRGDEPFLFLWDGTTLTPGTGPSVLRDLSCAFGPRCAVARGPNPVLLGNGRTWSEQTMATVAGLSAPVLNAATCETSTCIVAGSATGADGRPRPVAFRMKAPIR